MTRIHNIGHIHNANFAQTQFSTSHLQKQHFLKSWKFTFLSKYLVCGFKFEISEYPIKSLYVTYSPYKYELERIKTHEMRAKNFPPVFFSVHGSEILWYRFSCHNSIKNVSNVSQLTREIIINDQKYILDLNKLPNPECRSVSGITTLKNIAKCLCKLSGVGRYVRLCG